MNTYMPDAPEILKEVLQIIPNAWLFAGTLLGFVREGKILDWDRDIDLGVNSDDVSRSVIEELKKNNFRIRKLTTFKEDVIQSYVPDSKNCYSKIVAHKKGVKVEILCFKKGIPLNRTGKLCDMLYYRQGIIKHSPRLFALPYYMALPTKKVSMYDFTVNIPENYSDHLGYIFGKDWQTPKQKWYFTPEHYLCRERTVIELYNDDNSKWSKYTGRRVIANYYGPQDFPEDINKVFVLKR
jgi:hypothetical protein